jgi:hypothetical protein
MKIQERRHHQGHPDDADDQKLSQRRSHQLAFICFPCSVNHCEDHDTSAHIKLITATALQGNPNNDWFPVIWFTPACLQALEKSHMFSYLRKKGE